MEPSVLNETTKLLSIGRSMARRRRQNGWVKKTGKRVRTWTGFWYEYVTVDGLEKRRERCKVIGKCADMTKGDAQEKVRAIIRGWRPPLEGATFEQLAISYLRTNEGCWGKNWKVSVNAMFDYHILPLLGKREAATVKRSEIQQAMNAIAANPNCQSKSFLEKCLMKIRAVYQFAIDDDLLEKNPALKVVLPPHRDADQRYLSLDQCQQLLSVGELHHRLIVRLFMVCGLRPSEMFALRVSDILNGELNIDETIVKMDLTPRTKTWGSKATVPLSAALESELRRYAVEANLTNDSFLFPSAIGTAMSPDNYLDRVLKPHGLLAGIEGLTHQMLRRTTATHFQKHGTVKDAQALLRHSNPQTTLNHYQKVLPESLVRGVNNWDAELVRSQEVLIQGL